MERMELFPPRKKGPQEDRNRTTVVAAESQNDGEANTKATEEIPNPNGTQQGDTMMDSESSILGQEKGNAKTETESQAVMPLSLSDQDLAVYGNLNARLADVFSEGIEAAISKGVDSLPLLDDGGDDCYRGKSLSSLPEEDGEGQPTDTTKSPKQRLWDALRYRFVRNVDVLEAYCAHHLLTLRKHPPARRKRIVAVMRDGIEALPSLPSKGVVVDNDETNNERVTETGGKLLYPTRSELPSEEETKDLAEELSRLQARLESAKQKRNALLASVESANRAEQAVSDVVATIEANLPTSLDQDAIRSDVSEKVEKGNTVSLLADEAKTLVGKLDGIKRDRSSNSQNNKHGNGDDGFDFVQRDDPLHKASQRIGTNKRQKPLSLEEAYRRDRRELGLLRDSTNNNNNDSDIGTGSGSSGPSMSVLRSMLMAPPPSTSSSTLPPPSTPTN